MKFTEIKQKANPGLGIHDNNKKVCPGFSYSDSISWITNQPERYELFAKTLIDNFPKAKTWLELGCGPGCLSYYIKEHGDNINYVTLDINKDAGGLQSTGYVYIGEDPDSVDGFDVDDEDGQREHTTVKLIREDIEDLI